MTLLVYLLSLLHFLLADDDVSLVLAGDAMQHDRQIAAARQSDGMYDYKECFQYVSDYISEADYAVVNLECTLGGKPYSGYPCFSAPDSYALALKSVGFDLFLHANNHCLDRRDSGLLRTLDKLDQYNISHIGTYRNKEEYDSQTPFIITIKGLKIAFINYTYGTNGISVQRDVVVNYIDKNKIRTEIKKAKSHGADLIVACMHWGVEYKLLPNGEQKNLALFLQNEGVDLIIGGHPHVIQPMELHHDRLAGKDNLIVYSLGNFISAMRTADTRGGSMVKVIIGRKAGKPYIKHVSYKLFFVQPPFDNNSNYELIPADKKSKVRKDNIVYFDKFMGNARRIFGKYNIGISEDFGSPFKSYNDYLISSDDSL